jgi:16S rRNA (guanine1516-N2)-methyltransferase
MSTFQTRLPNTLMDSLTNKTQMQSPTFQIAILATQPHLQGYAKNLAKEYLLPFIESFDPSEQKRFNFVLKVTDQGVTLSHTEKKAGGNLRINFLQGKIAFRLKHLQNQKNLLAKAIGSKTRIHTILDLTAGFANDSMVLAQLGFSVTLLERSKIVVLLLNDALQRALTHEKFAHIKMKLIYIDAFLYLKQLKSGELPDVIYLDPMYPDTKKSALAKKEMFFLRHIVGNDLDSAELLPLALSRAKQRIIVKRPCSADFLSAKQPHHSIVGKQVRFDIYLTH